MNSEMTLILYENQAEQTSYHYVHTPHLASALVEEGYYQDNETLKEALDKVIRVCLALNVPVTAHFHHIYVHSATGHTDDDWALSDLAFYLLLLNGDVRNGDVAFAQAYAVRKAFLH